MGVRVEERIGGTLVVVSIDGRGILRIHHIDPDSGEVLEQWTDSQFARLHARVSAIHALVGQAREIERQKEEEPASGNPGFPVRARRQ